VGVPVFVVHDHDDREVPFGHAEALSAAWGGEVLATDRLGHTRILEAPEVVRAAVGFVACGAASDRAA
jgi:predicted alpha/beta hydrolase family esterase